MSTLKQYASSGVGSKKLMGITGLGLCLFLLTHMLGNMLILVGPEAFNSYSYKLVTNPLLIVAELGLLGLIAVHIIKGLMLSLRNMGARPQKYAVKSNGDKKTTFVSRTLGTQGAIILFFIINHLITFKWGSYYQVSYNGGPQMRDLYRLVLEVFHKPGFVIWYIVALLILGLHVGHGFYSSLQSLGFNHPKYKTFLKVISYLFDFAVTVGFVILPIYVYILHD